MGVSLMLDMGRRRGTHVANLTFMQLQEEFSKGNLQAGLIVRKAPLKTYTNNVVSSSPECWVESKVPDPLPDKSHL